MIDRRVELVHAHQYTPFFYSALARLRHPYAFRLILTEHGRHYSDTVSRKRLLGNRILLARCCDASTACSRFSAAAIRNKDGFRNVEVIPTVSIADAFEMRTRESQRQALSELDLSPHLQYVTCIARFHPVKDHANVDSRLESCPSAVFDCSLVARR